jgi:hypothetical protein
MHIVTRRYIAIAAFLGLVLLIYVWAYRLDQSVVIGMIAAFLIIGGSSALVWSVMGARGWAYFVGGMGLMAFGGFLLLKFGAYGNTILGFIMGGAVVATNTILVLRRTTKQLSGEQARRLRRAILFTGLVFIGASGIIVQLAAYLAP